MLRSITADDVLRLMQPVLGARFPRGTGLDEQTAQLLRAYQPRRESFDSLLHRLQECIFSGVYAYLGSAMLLQLEDGRVRRIMLQDVEHLTDLCSGLVLMTLPAGEVTLEQLRQMAMSGGSLGAMQALLHRYGDALPEMERQTIERILRENGAAL